MSLADSLDPRPKLTFHGNLIDDLWSRVLGPDDLGGYMVVESVVYDSLLNVTHAYVRPIGRAEMVNTVFDEHGQRFLPIDRPVEP